MERGIAGDLLIRVKDMILSRPHSGRALLCPSGDRVADGRITTLCQAPQMVNEKAVKKMVDFS